MPQMPRNPPWFPAAYLGALIGQLALAVGLLLVGWQQTGQFPLAASDDRGVLVAGPQNAMADTVSRLLRERSRAILDRDRSAFLATVDFRSPDFTATQARLYQRVIEVPLAAWEHDVARPVSPSVGRQLLPELQRRYGAPVWLAEVTVRHRFDAVPEFELSGTHYYTFVLRDGAWYLAADDDLTGVGLRTSRQLWDFGPVVAAAGEGSLVLGHRVQQGFVTQVGRVAERARRSVADLFGSESSTYQSPPLVVMVPADLTEARGLLPEIAGDGDGSSQPLHLSTLSAVTTSASSTDPRAAHVVVNTDVLVKLDEREQAAVLRHESAHVAARDVAAGTASTWLSEGIAEYAAYVGGGLGPVRFAPELTAAVRSGQLPDRLPGSRDFSAVADTVSRSEPGTSEPGTSEPSTGAAYRQAWSACALLVERVGFAELVELYRLAAGHSSPSADSVWSSVLQERLNLTSEEFVQLWQEYLVTSFAP